MEAFYSGSLNVDDFFDGAGAGAGPGAANTNYGALNLLSDMITHTKSYDALTAKGETRSPDRGAFRD